MRKYKKLFREILSAVFIIILLISSLFYQPKVSLGANYTFTQTDWAGGASASTAVHPTNQTNWNQFSSASSTIATSTVGQISLASTTASTTKTTDTDFSGGTFTSTTVSGTGTAGSVKLLNYQDTVLNTSALVSYWKMDESVWNGTSGEVIDSKGTNHGISTGAVTISTAKYGPYAGSFDGNDYVSLPMSFPTANFTIEGWVKFNNVATQAQTIFGGNADWKFGIMFNYTGNNRLIMDLSSTGSSWNIANAVTGLKTSWTSGQWYHIVFKYDGTSYKVFVDGVEDISVTSSTSIFNTTALWVGKWGNSTFFLGGLIDELAIYNTALSASTISEHYSAYSSGVYTSASIDTGQKSDFGNLDFNLTNTDNGSYTKLLLHTNGTDGLTTFTDSGSTVPVHNLTAVGNAQIDTAQSKFGGASGLFDGTGDYLTVPDHADWDFGAGDFTIDAWIKTSQTTGGIGGQWGNLPFSSVAWRWYFSSNRMYFDVSNGSGYLLNLVATSGDIATGEWQHVAIVRYGNVWTLYLGGVNVGSTTVAGTMNNGVSVLSVGAYIVDNIPSINGWVDEFRISNGIARWTANFTPPNAPYNAGAVKFQLAANNDNATWNYYGPDGATSTYYTATSTAISSSLDNNRYIRYKAYLSTADTQYIPSLDDITINYSYYSTSSSLTSSSYDTIDNANLIGGISWAEDSSLPSGSGVTVSLRTASTSAGLNSANWTDFTNATTNCSKASGTVTCSAAAIPSSMKDGSEDRWLQYKVSLTSLGNNTPTFSSVSITYIVNASPEFNPDYPTAGAGGASTSQNSSSTDANWGKAQINYSVRDPDTTTGDNRAGNNVTPSFEYNIGAGWNPIASGYLAAEDLSNKTVDETTYTIYSATWDAKSQIAGNYTTSAQIRVTVDDGELANNTSSSTSAAFTLDTKNPTSTAFIINSASSTITFTLSDDSNIEYRLSNNSDFSDSSWQSVGANSTSTTLTWTAAGTYPTVYLNTRDIYSNTATTTAVAPSAPASFSVKDISNPGASYYEEFINWQVYSATTSAAFANYKLYRSTDSVNYSVLTTITDVNTNYYRDTSVSSSTTYYYKMLINDTNTDVSSWSTIVSDQPDGQGGTDNTAPTITNASSIIQATWVKITWTTDELSNSEVGYSVSPDNGFGSTASSTSYVTSHEVTLTGLTPNTTYLYRIRSRDILNNLATADNSGAGYNFTTLGGPVISDVTTESATDNSVTITWNTNKAANSYVVYSTNLTNLKNNVSVSEVGSATLVNSPFQHRVQLTGLNQRTTYYYYVKSTDSDSNIATDTNGSNYYSFKTTYDTKAPVISNIASPVITKSAAFINWQTDEDATSQVEYGGTSGSYPSVTTIDSTLSIYHAVVLSNLSTNTKYYYHVKSTDGSGNSTTSDENNFTTSNVDQIIVSTAGGSAPAPLKDTTPPAISNIEVSNLSAFGANIGFETSEPSVAFVLYGKNNNYGETAGSSDFVNKHEIKLSGLRLGTTYHFQIKAQDKDNNSTRSEDKTFTTKFATEALEETVVLENASQFQEQLEGIIESVMPSLVPPYISGVEVEEVSENSAVIKWRSNVPAYGALAYSKEADYDSSKENPYVTEISSGTAKARSHQLSLTNLSPSTIYHIQAKAFSIPGVVGKYKDITFITKASRIQPQITKVGNTDVEIRWITDEETSSFVEYRDLRTGKIARKGDETKTKSHAVSLDNLTPDTSYQLRAFGYDQKNNIAEGDPVAIRTKKDVAVPVISDVRIDNALLPGRTDRLQSVISWRTNEPANSLVYFEEGVGIEEDLANKIGQEKEFSTDHIIIITSLKPSTIYRIKIVSADESNNIASSPVRSILTPRSAESVLDVIVRNLQDTFGFLRKIKQ